ncbi:hypothetical protein [Pseudomonas bharatica]|uniref:hypothetical protein n=1 Tax=Pseudomonas bharatica TaxID=2692112 RepID=UPI003B280B03
MRISVDKLVAFGWAFPLACLSLLLLPYAVEGDQQFYRDFYANVGSFGLSDAYTFYNNRLGTKEPGYFLFVYLFSDWFDKDVVFSLVNGLLYYHIFLWLRRQRVSTFLYPLLACNFYLIVLSFSAERLKLALTIFLVGYSLKGLFRYSVYAISLVSHVQLILLLVGTQVRRALEVIRKLMLGRVGLGFVSLFIILIGVLALLFLLREHIEAKLAFYSGAWGGFGAMLKPLVFTFMAMFYSRERKIEALFVSLPMVIASFFIGSERVVIFSYFVFMYYAASYRRGINVGVLTSAMFFAYKGIGFAMTMIELGDGFAGTY